MTGNPLNPLNPRDRAAMEAALDARWEHGRVRFTMQRVGLGNRFVSLHREFRRRTDHEYLTLACFNEEYQTFPVLLGCSRLRHIKKPLHLYQPAAFPNWLRNFIHLPFMEDYERLYDSLGQRAHEKPVGLIFPRNGFPQGLIIHNGDLETYAAPGSSCFVYLAGEKGRRKSKRLSLVVQPYASFLAYLHGENGQNWHLED